MSYFLEFHFKIYFCISRRNRPLHKILKTVKIYICTVKTVQLFERFGGVGFILYGVLSVLSVLSVLCRVARGNTILPLYYKVKDRDKWM